MEVCGCLLNWYDAAKRDLPWRHTRDPYRIWVSEIMLQQTRAETAIEYYQRFLQLFPTVEALAAATEQSVLKAWEGLGYYSRARSLRSAAKLIVEEYGGAFPRTASELLKLPGVGAYTAGAVASIAFGERIPAIDGNAARVMARFCGIRENISGSKARIQLSKAIMTAMPASRPGDFNQALMELGAAICIPRAPRCDACPWAQLCDARREGDAALLPVSESKRPPKHIEVAVCLLTRDGHALVSRRDERMLKGMYVFPLAENETNPARVLELFAEQGLKCRFIGMLGTAKHTFTHRVWEMTLMHFELCESPDARTLENLDGHMADLSELDALPFPAAMKAAKDEAKRLLE